MNLPEDDKRKVEGILARLASDFDGERAAAGLLLTRILAKHKLRPENLLNGGSSQSEGYLMARRLLDKALAENARLQRQVRAGQEAVGKVAGENAALRQKIARLEQAQARPQPQPQPEEPQWTSSGLGTGWASHVRPPDSRYLTAAARADRLLKHPFIHWTAWEREFLTSMLTWRGAPTARQADVLTDLEEKAKQTDAAREKAAGIWG